MSFELACKLQLHRPCHRIGMRFAIAKIGPNSWYQFCNCKILATVWEQALQLQIAYHHLGTDFAIARFLPQFRAQTLQLHGLCHKMGKEFAIANLLPILWNRICNCMICSNFVGTEFVIARDVPNPMAWNVQLQGLCQIKWYGNCMKKNFLVSLNFCLTPILCVICCPCMANDVAWCRANG